PAPTSYPRFTMRPASPANTVQTNSPVVLVVDDDLFSRRRIARMLAPDAIARPVGSLEDARRAWMQTPASALIVELNLCANTILWLEELRSKDDAPPVLATSDTATLDQVSRASAAGIPFVAKSASDGLVERRLKTLVTEAHRCRNARRLLAERLATRGRLTPAEVEAMVLFLENNGQRSVLAAKLGIAETSVRSRVRGVCRKLGIPHLHEVYRLLLDDALAG
ncbi:MAG: hypothetical protein AAGA56_20875, partial [Myxococcota bacterium]